MGASGCGGPDLGTIGAPCYLLDCMEARRAKLVRISMILLDRAELDRGDGSVAGPTDRRHPGLRDGRGKLRIDVVAAAA